MAEQVVVRDQDVRLREWERLSVQRGIKHPLAGLTGRALVTNIAEPLWPYLIVGQWVHVGKAASFGQGRYMVRIQQEESAAPAANVSEVCCEPSAAASAPAPAPFAPRLNPRLLSRRRGQGR